MWGLRVRPPHPPHVQYHPLRGRDRHLPSIDTPTTIKSCPSPQWAFFTGWAAVWSPWLRWRW